MSVQFDEEYAVPLTALLSLGDVRNFDETPDYLAMGFTENDTPELIRLSTDMRLYELDFEQPEAWATVHAWRVLGLLEAEDAIIPLLDLFHQLEGSYWTAAELPIVLAKIGTTAIPHMQTYLQNPSHPHYAKAKVVRSLRQMARVHPEAEAQIIEILTSSLERFEENENSLNGFLIRNLVSLHAVETAALIEQAYKTGNVDLHAAGGDWEQQQIRLGLKATSEKSEQVKPSTASTKPRNKRKQKRKQAKQSRKRNRK